MTDYGFFGFDANSQPILNSVKRGNRKAIIIFNSRQGVNITQLRQIVTPTYIRNIYDNSLVVKRVSDQRLQQFIEQELPDIPTQIQTLPPTTVINQDIQQFTSLRILYVTATCQVQILDESYPQFVLEDQREKYSIVKQEFGWSFFQQFDLNLSRTQVIRQILSIVKPLYLKKFDAYFKDKFNLLATDFYVIECHINNQKIQLRRRTHEF